MSWKWGQVQLTIEHLTLTALQNSIQKRKTNKYDHFTHGIMLVTTLRALDVKVANVGLFLEKNGDYGIKTFPQSFSKGPGQG